MDKKGVVKQNANLNSPNFTISIVFLEEGSK
jgi:hypothetical protein